MTIKKEGPSSGDENKKKSTGTASTGGKQQSQGSATSKPNPAGEKAIPKKKDENYGLEKVSPKPIEKPATKEQATQKAPVTAKSTPKAEKTTVKTTTTSKKEEKKSNDRIWLILIIILLLILVVVYYFFIFSKTEEPEKLPVEKEVTEQPVEEPIKEEETPVEELPVVEEPEAPVKGEILTISSRQGRFYVVVGSFFDEDGAEDKAMEIIESGINAYVITPQGGQPYTRVGIEESATLQEATTKLETLKGTFGNNIWVLKF